MDSKIEKWRRWLENEIQPEVMNMNLHRAVFQEVAAIIEANKSLPPSYWFDFSSEMYATSQAVAVRRQAEVGPRVITLARLIHEIGNNAGLLSREFWTGLWGDTAGAQLGIAHGAFTEQFAPDGGDQLDAAIPTADLAELGRVAEVVKTYVDQHIAHNDARPRDGFPTFADLNASIDLLGTLFAKYANLLTAAMWPILVPQIQHNWKAIFRQPWIT